MENAMPHRPAILIIEDDPVNLEIVGKRLALQCYHCIPAATGLVGLAQVQEQAIDLVLLDIGLPDIDGMALLTQILQVRPALPVVIMTAYGSPELEQLARQIGATEFLLKPVRRLTLLAVVEEALGTVNR
jgi:two-component system response regulator HydG